jgi:cell fate regulator YaaT (PSP1 superfamily)
MNTSIGLQLLYEIKVNPFRNEFATIKSESDKIKYRLQDSVVIQLGKEIFIGQIVKIKELTQSVPDLKCHILRSINQSDLARKEALHKKTEETKLFVEHLLKKFKLSAKVVYIDWDFNEHKVYCYLTSERKINYLLLHENAVDSLKARVAIKQIGVRDYARSIGGLGICGRELCCRNFLQTIQSVTLSMARQQNLYVEPEKISGACGKLHCCIAFEYLKR